MKKYKRSPYLSGAQDMNSVALLEESETQCHFFPATENSSSNGILTNSLILKQ